MRADSKQVGGKFDESGHNRYANLIYGVLFLVGIVFILLFLYFESATHSTSPPILVLLLREVGFALLISVLLVYSIERITRERHSKEMSEWVNSISRSVFEAVMARNTPKSVFIEVEKNLLYRDYVRKDTSVTYTIRSLPDDARNRLPEHERDRYRLCEVAFHHHILNVNQANRSISYPLRLFLDVGVSPAALHDLFRVDLVEVDGNTIEVASTRDGQSLSLEHSVQIPREGQVKVRCKWTQAVKTEDQEIWCCVDPTEGVSFTVNTPDGDLSVWADSMHSEPLEEISRSEYGVAWRLNHGIFPYQGIYFRWNRR